MSCLGKNSINVTEKTLGNHPVSYIILLYPANDPIKRVIEKACDDWRWPHLNLVLRLQLAGVVCKGNIKKKTFVNTELRFPFCVAVCGQCLLDCRSLAAFTAANCSVQWGAATGGLPPCVTKAAYDAAWRAWEQARPDCDLCLPPCRAHSITVTEHAGMAPIGLCELLLSLVHCSRGTMIA